MRKIGRDLPPGKSREKYIVMGKIHLRIYMEKCVEIFLLGNTHRDLPEESKYNV